MISQESTANVSAKLEYPACPVCGGDQRQFPFRLHAPYSVARCMECGFHYLYPRLIETAIQEAYRQSSYYEGGTCGYADTSYTAQESALRATFKRLLYNLARRDLTGGDLLEIGCGYGYLLDEARSLFDRRVGTEFSPQGAEIARETGAEVFVRSIEQVAPEPGSICYIHFHGGRIVSIAGRVTRTSRQSVRSVRVQGSVPRYLIRRSRDLVPEVGAVNVELHAGNAMVVICHSCYGDSA
jgi:hypothetical protein